MSVRPDHGFGVVEVVEPAADRGSARLRRRLRRMAFDVHDGPMQDLIGIAYRLRSLRATAVASGDPLLAERLAAEIDELTAQTSATEQRLRSLMFTLENGAAPDGDVMALVAEQVDAFRRYATTPVQVVAEGDLEVYTDSQRIALARVLRESLTNVAKHAQATRVTVRLRGSEDVLLLQVQDDGVGFVVDAPHGTDRPRMGLAAMRERLALIGGSLEIRSRPGGPTTVTAQIHKWRPTAGEER